MPEKLLPGTHSVDRATPRKLPDGGYSLDYRICYKDGRVSNSFRAKAPTIGEVRRIARARAQSRLQTDGDSEWLLTDKILAFIDNEVAPSIENDKIHAQRTVDSYRLSLSRVRKHARGYSIASFIKTKTLKKVLNDIAEAHGTESARQARNILTDHVIRALRDHGLMDSNPLYGLKLASTSPTRRQRQTISADEWREVLNWVLADDANTPMPGATSPASHKKDAIARHSRVKDLTLLQMTTGARSVEALALKWDQLTRDDEGNVWVELHGKTKMGRTVPILSEKVAKHFWNKRQDAGYVIGAPADTTKQWDRSLASRAVR